MTTPFQHRQRWRVFRITTLVPICLISTIIVAFLIMSRESIPSSPVIPGSPSTKPPNTHPIHLIYSSVPGYFAQSLSTTDDSTFNPLTTSFGLLPRSYPTDPSLPGGTQWQRFTHHLLTLNADSPKTTSYRLLFLSRHGQGYHNVAQQFFGTEKWDCYYSTLNGSKKISWADAELTDLGVGQAEEVRDYWMSQMREGMPEPEGWYVSPLQRAVRTADIVFGGEKEFKPIIKEMLREGIGIHTCDRRSSASYLRTTYPEFKLESYFSEDDPLWLPDLREPGAAQTIRLRALLDEVLAHEPSIVISMTSHGGTIQSILRAVGHREFTVGTGGMIPVLVRVDVVEGKRGEETVDWEKKPKCVGGEPGREEVEEQLRRLDESLRDAEAKL